MKRRTYLGLASAGGLSATAGCLETLGLGSSATVLDAPEKRGDPSHPIHGEEIPSFSVTDVLSGETVSNETFEGERTQLYTFVYTNCPDGTCPALLQRLYTPSQAIREAGHESDAAFVPITFDPRRDTPEAIADHVEAFNIDPDSEMWYFLRPSPQEAAYELVFDDFGLPIKEQRPGEDDGHDGHQHSNETVPGSNESDVSDYTFTHFALILLVNDRGVVERSYPRATRFSPETIQEDMLAVIEG
ncbi:SCO family protein [Halovivax limisalsi]|uniref:SCO family protein n=1 Tax=Halovivax limisalsi TaxID=1453760 RepID=UPI001FFD8B15|nr:SCO family protein [Halovivax limisalsi]